MAQHAPSRVFDFCGGAVNGLRPVVAGQMVGCKATFSTAHTPCAWARARTCACPCMCTHVHMCAQLCVNVCACAFACDCMLACARLRAHVTCVRACVHARVHTCMHACMHSHVTHVCLRLCMCACALAHESSHAYARACSVMRRRVMQCNVMHDAYIVWPRTQPTSTEPARPCMLTNLTSQNAFAACTRYEP